ncbi:proteasome subunit beta type-6-like [Panonychus citri]|uniref:proteasome subunit beta type-6-like n=1 Tax=Panonychus citri TaxID=50023 RepID=UPI0023075F83|nr:proteasome subunit beta type-6-like [Panonychus citri]
MASIQLALDWEKDDYGLEKNSCPSHLDSLIPDWIKTPLSTGTTLLAAEYDGGVYIGADTRTSTGAYVAARYSDKLTYITDQIYCCRSGSAADTQAIAEIVKYHLSFYEMEVGEPAPVKVAANIFRDLCYQYRDQLTAGIIVAGWDKREKGQIYMVPLGGMLLRLPVAMGGSGSSYIVGHVDGTYKPKMSKEECRKFIIESITHAINRDGSSGGCVRLANISESGVEREDIEFNNLPRFQDI